MSRMPAGGEPRRRPPDAGNGPTFTVERFGWGAPDRLEVAGTFAGLDASPPADAVLTVFGEDGAHRLPAVDDDGSRLLDGAHLTAAFAWLEAPVAFQHARLELGGRMAVDLLGPDVTGAEALPVKLLGAPAAETATEPPQRESGLLEEMEQLEQGLASVRRAAAEALAAADAEIAALRERIAELEPARAERDAARAELARAHEELDAARRALAAVREQAQALLGLSDAMPGRR